MTRERNAQMKKTSSSFSDMGFPKQKPQSVKRKEEKYPPLFPITKDCYFCGSTQGLERHHCFGGVANRPLSEKYGAYLNLCKNCHLSITSNKDIILVTRLKKDAQGRFEALWGHDKFIEVFRRNYL